MSNWQTVRLGPRPGPKRDWTSETLPDVLPLGAVLLAYRGSKAHVAQIQGLYDRQICRPGWWAVVPKERAEHLMALHQGRNGASLFETVSLEEMRARQAGGSP